MELLCTLLLVVTVLCLAGCPFTPPIKSPPSQLDSPPMAGEDDILPANERSLEIDRSANSETLFELLRARDLDEDDEIEFAFFLVSRGGTTQVFDGTLRRQATQATQGVTVYESVTYALDPCRLLVRNLDEMTVRLRLTDAIPVEQQDELGKTEHTVDISWHVVFTESCPIN